MNYSNNANHCRLDIFKESGKWYTTETLDMTGFYDELDGFKLALLQHFSDGRFMHEDDNCIFVCLDPYLKHEFPRCTSTRQLKQFKQNQI